MGLHMAVTKWPKLIIFTLSHKKPPKRLILLNESAETSCVISIEVNLSKGILIMGPLTTKMFVAERNVAGKCWGRKINQATNDRVFIHE